MVLIALIAIALHRFTCHLIALHVHTYLLRSLKKAFQQQYLAL